MYSVELYGRVRRACHVDGMSERAAGRFFGIDRKTVSKILKHSVPPGYRREGPPVRPKLDPFIGIIDRILEEDRARIKKQRHTVFVHGCFWHRHPGCRFATMPATRPEFWQEKFKANVERDVRNLEALRHAGWRTAVIWECGLRRDNAENTIVVLAEWLASSSDAFEVPST